MKLINFDPVGAYPPVHDVFLMRKLHVPLLQTHVRGIVSLNNLVQRDRKLLPALLSVLPQLFDGQENDHGILGGGINVDHLAGRGLLEFPDSGLQAIILESMFSFLAKQRNRTHRLSAYLF